MSDPLLSVCLITYNHAKYIRGAVDGVLMQQVNFPWELIIADDCSTDGTREIVLDYKKKYPDLIRLIVQEKNVGAAKNWHDLITAPKSKYIAYCEGDDYWVDPLKLQKQVDFLESQPECSSCFHPVDWLVQETGHIDIAAYGPPFIAEYYDIDDLLRHSNFIPSCSDVFRKHLAVPLPEWFLETPIGDFPLHLLLSSKGKIGFMNESMGVYRHHKAGIYGGKYKKEQCRILIATYLLAGAKLNLKKMLSWQAGISAACIELCETCMAKGDFWQAIKAGCSGTQYAPHYFTSYMLDKMTSALSGFFKPALAPAEKFASSIRYHGLKAIIKKGIYRVTGMKAQ